VSVEATTRVASADLLLALLVRVLALVAIWRLSPTVALGVLASGGVLVSAVWRLASHLRRPACRIALRDERLLIDGEPIDLASAWVGRGWLVLKGRCGGQRLRLSLRAAEIGVAAFARVSRFVVRSLPVVNRPRVGGRRGA
jgi:hypothetical protein